MTVAPLRIVVDRGWQDSADFLSEVIREAVSASYSLSWVAGVDQGQFVRSSLSGQITGIANDPVLHSLIVGIGRVMQTAFAGIRLMVDEGDDLTTVDFQILERAYIALGAEIDRRRDIHRTGSGHRGGGFGDMNGQ